VRAPVDHIHAPAFPRAMRWINVASLRMDQQRGRPVLIEFFDVCRAHSLRTLPYVQAWHERYAEVGLRVVSIHAPGHPPALDEDVVRASVERLGIELAVGLDHDFHVWHDYGNKGWPARYLFTGESRLLEYHYGLGGYAETELAIQELLGVDRALVPPLRPEDEPSARIVVPTPDQPGAYSGPYVAGTAWAVLDGRGEVRANGRPVAVEHPGAYVLAEHPVSTEGVLDLEVGAGVECLAVCFTPGLAAPSVPPR
jgi:hypothetical protein